jgi:hypothetical protein
VHLGLARDIPNRSSNFLTCDGLCPAVVSRLGCSLGGPYSHVYPNFKQESHLGTSLLQRNLRFLQNRQAFRQVAEDRDDWPAASAIVRVAMR